MNNKLTYKKAGSVFIAAVIIASMVTVGFAVTPIDVAGKEETTRDADKSFSDISGLEGSLVYFGQSVAVGVDGQGLEDGDTVTLREVTGDSSSSPVSQLTVQQDTDGLYVQFDTSERPNADYFLSGGNLDQDNTEFEIVNQDLEFTFSKDSVSNAGNTEVDIDTSSALRNSYVVTFTANGLSEKDLENLFSTSNNENVTDRYVENGELLYEAIDENKTSEDAGNYILTEDAIHVFNAEGTRTLDFEGISPGEYTFTADVLDTAAQSTSEIGVFGEVVGPGDPPEYDLRLKNDGTAYTVGFPGPTAGTLNDVFTNGLEGVSAVYEYDANVDQWRLLKGNDFNEPPAALDAVVIVTTGETGPNEIDLEITFTNESVTSPTSQTLTKGWAFITASTADDADTVFNRGSAEMTVVLDAFAAPEVQQVDTAPSFQYQQPTPYYDLETGEPPQMSPFAGYFVHVTESGTYPSLLSGIETRQESDAALNLTDTS
jgi:hypothetical protein